VRRAEWAAGYVCSLFGGDGFSHSLELVVDFFDLLPDFCVDVGGVVALPLLPLLELGADVVEVLIDVVADDDEPIAVVGLGLCVADFLP
jgi:hypothetical protein